MRIEIESVKLNCQHSFVTFKYIPNWLDKLLRIKVPPSFTRRYVTEYHTYLSGGGYVYYDEYGDELGNGSEVGKVIDREYIKQRLKL